MSLLFIDGFDDGLAGLPGKWSTASGTTVFTTGRNGNGFTFSVGGFLTKQVASTDENVTFIVGFAYKPISVGAADSSSDRIQFTSDNGATIHLTLNLKDTGLLPTVKRGDYNGTLLGTASSPLIQNAWNYVEFKATLSDTVGAFTLRLNGATIANAASVDTKNAGTKTTFDSITLRLFSSSNGIVDDFYFCNGAGTANNDFLGDCVVETLYPSGNGSSSQFLGSDGDSVNNYALVNNTGAPNTATYVGSATVGNVDLYAMGDLSHTSGTVKGVQNTSYIAKSDAGARSAQTAIKSGATTATGQSTALSTTFTTLATMREQDPNTSAAWTISGVNAIEAGVEVSA